jgi:uncharacterized membrane protein YidH (DUF202 family)
MSITGILIGLGLLVAGVAFVKYTFAIVNFTGRQDWLEKFTGPGTTYGDYKLLGVLLVILGILTATGFGVDVMNWMLSPLKSVFHPLHNIAN